MVQASQVDRDVEQSLAGDREADIPIDTADLSLAELTRIMDVATTLRKERVVAVQQLRLDETKAMLRQKLLEAAAIRGESISPAEIDAAIDNYFENLHAFDELALSPSLILAHLYVRRTLLVAVLAIVLALGVTVAAWFGWSAARTAQKAESLWSQYEANRQAIAAVAVEGQIAERLAQEADEVQLYRESRDFDRLTQAVERSTALRQQLEAEYQIVVVHEPGQQSAIDRYFDDDQGQRVSGYYLIVEAREADGTSRGVEITNRESGQRQVVQMWAEQVPQAVYRRLADDKTADGVLDEFVFGEKKRGELDVQIVMPGSDGEPLIRQGQITSW